jgi:hypothetical protein
MNPNAAGGFVTVIDWLLDSDPSPLASDAGPDRCARRGGRGRARAGRRRGPGREAARPPGKDGRWGGAAWNRGWNSTMHVLMLLRDLGLDPASGEARRAVERVRERVTWQGCGPQECDGNAFFQGVKRH